MYFKAPFVIEKTLSALPWQLVGEKEIKKLRVFAQLLPEQIATSFFGYECPLSADKQWVDLSIYTPLLTSQLNSLISEFVEKKVSNEIQSSALWSLFVTLLRDGLDHHFFSKENIQFLWTEFDVGSSPLWPPDPNLYFPVSNVNQLETTCVKLFDLMKKNEVLHPSISLLQRCIEQCLIENLKVTHLGFMLPRTKSGIRLCIGNFAHNPDLLKRFLKKIGYKPEQTPLITLLSQLSPFSPTANLYVDLEETVKAKLGLECCPPDSTILERGNKWIPLLDFLVSEGYTTFKKQQGALSWIGGFKEELYASELFENMAPNATSRSSSLQVVRNINHLKFIYTPEKEQKLEAKIYLSASCTRRDLEPDNRLLV